MKILKFILVTVILVSFTSCNKKSLEDDIFTKVEFYPNNHVNILQIETDILTYINEHRNTVGLNSLDLDSTTGLYSNSHTEYMIEKSEISHDLWQKRANNLIKDTGATGAAENVADGYKTGIDVVIAWLVSEGHKKNIEGDWTHTGITVKIGDDGKYYFTQIFIKK